MTHLDTVIGIEGFAISQGGRQREVGINLPWKDVRDRVQSLKTIGDMMQDRWKATPAGCNIQLNSRRGDTIYIRFTFNSHADAVAFDKVFDPT